MTITEIAKKAGVSIGTVDRVIHKRGRVSQETKEKIEQIIITSGYKPNPIAQHLKNNREYTIGVLIPLLKSENSYWQSLYDSIYKASQELTFFSLRILCFEFDKTIKGNCFFKGKELLKHNIDALILAPIVQDEALKVISLLEKIPYAFVDSQLPNSNPLATVAQNPFKAGYCAARIMDILRPNSKQFLCIQMNSAEYKLSERARGFCAYFARTAIAEVYHATWDWSENQNDYFTFLDSLFNQYPLINGIFITNDLVYKLREYLLSRKKEKSFGIIGFDSRKNNAHCLLDGSVDMLISQQTEKQGFIVINEIYRKVILNQQNDTDIDVGIEIYFKENLPEFIMR